MNRRKGARAPSPAPVGGLPQPLPAHPQLGGNPNAEVLVQIVAHDGALRLGVNLGVVALWQRSRTVESARTLRKVIATRNAAHFVSMLGADPLFREIPELDGL